MPHIITSKPFSPEAPPTDKPGLHPDWCEPWTGCQRDRDREHRGMPGTLNLVGDDVRIDFELLHAEDVNSGSGEDVAETWLQIQVRHQGGECQPVEMILDEKDLMVLQHQLEVYARHLQRQRQRRWEPEARLAAEVA